METGRHKETNHITKGQGNRVPHERDTNNSYRGTDTQRHLSQNQTETATQRKGQIQRHIDKDMCTESHKLGQNAQLHPLREP